MKSAFTIYDCLGLIPKKLGVTPEQIINDLSATDLKPKGTMIESLYMALSAGLEYRDAKKAVPHLERSREIGEDGPETVLAVALAFGTSLDRAASATLDLVVRHPATAEMIRATCSAASGAGMTIDEYASLLGEFTDQGRVNTRQPFWRERFIEQAMMEQVA